MATSRRYGRRESAAQSTPTSGGFFFCVVTSRGDDRKAQEGQSHQDGVKMLVPKFAFSCNLSLSNAIAIA